MGWIRSPRDDKETTMRRRRSICSRWVAVFYFDSMHSFLDDEGGEKERQGGREGLCLATHASHHLTY